MEHIYGLGPPEHEPLFVSDSLLWLIEGILSEGPPYLTSIYLIGQMGRSCPGGTTPLKPGFLYCFSHC